MCGQQVKEWKKQGLEKNEINVIIAGGWIYQHPHKYVWFTFIMFMVTCSDAARPKYSLQKRNHYRGIIVSYIGPYIKFSNPQVVDAWNKPGK